MLCAKIIGFYSTYKIVIIKEGISDIFAGI